MEPHEKHALLNIELAQGELEAQAKIPIIELAQGELEAQAEISVEMTDADKTAFDNAWRMYKEMKHDKVVSENVAMEPHHQAFATLGAAEQQAVHVNAKKCYPTTRVQVPHLHETYTTKIMPKKTPSKGSSLAQKGGKGDNDKGGDGKEKDGKEKRKGRKPYDKKLWKNKTCFNCKKKRHPAFACPKKKNNDDDESIKYTNKSVEELSKAIKELWSEIA